MPLFDAADTGKFVAAIMLQASDLLGHHVFGATDWYTPNEVVSTVAKVSGKITKYQAVSDETFKSFLPLQIAEEMTETFVFMRDYAYYDPGAEQVLTSSLKVRPP